MLLDVDTLNKLWYPKNYYTRIKDTLDNVFSEEEGELVSSILESSKANAEIRNSRMRRRASFMLAITALLLFLTGYESSFSGRVLEYEWWYNAVVITYLFSVLICFTCRLLFNKWNTTAVLAVLVIVCLAFLMKLSLDFPFFAQASPYYPVFVVALVTLPVLWEIFLRWLFSSVYSGYLRSYVMKVKRDYDNAIVALKSSGRIQIPRVYRKLIKDSLYSSSGDKTLSDICIQGYIDIRNNKLFEISQYPNGFRIFISWIGYTIQRCFKWGKSLKGTRNNSLLPLQANSLAVVPPQKDDQVVILNFQKEYDEFVFERAKMKGKLSVKQFCQQHNYDSDAMVTWLKQRKKKDRV